MKLQVKCPHCGKVSEVLTETRVEGMGIFKSYACGHTVVEAIVAVQPKDLTKKLVCKRCLEVEPNGNGCGGAPDTAHEVVEIPVGRLPMFARAFHYQQTGVQLLERANFNAALCDEMGLGKTIQVLQAVAHNRGSLLPTLYVLKPSLLLNWANEMVNNGWLCDKSDPMDYPFIISPGGAVLPGFKHYLIGMSVLKEHKAALKEIGFKLIVVDESQAFANTTSQRTAALLDIAKNIPHRICTSGTPILNRASEYWPTLNLIKPDHWPSYASFRERWIDTDDNGKMRGIKDWKRTEFFDRTAPYVIRRLKREVLTDLPAFSRHFIVVDISQTAYKNAYNKEVTGLDNYMNSEAYLHAGGFARSTTLLGYLMRMRHLCGMAKVELAVEHVVDFLNSTDPDQKIIIGVHHDDVMRMLRVALAHYNPVMLDGGMDGNDRYERIEKFKLSENRVCLAKILAAGEGLNLQFCANMLVLERMWNPGKEEQFEARIDRYGQTQPSVADYLVAKGTVDEDFSQMVEEKRQIVGETLNENFNLETSGELLAMLGERAAKRRL